MFRSSGPGLLALLAAATLPAAGCIWIFHHVEVASVSRPADSVTVESPVKAHLANGFTVVYPQGVRVVGDTVRGSGTRYDLQLRDATPVSQVPLDSVVAMESFETRVDAGTSFAVSTLVSVGVPAPLRSLGLGLVRDPFDRAHQASGERQDVNHCREGLPRRRAPVPRPPAVS